MGLRPPVEAEHRHLRRLRSAHQRRRAGQPQSGLDRATCLRAPVEPDQRAASRRQPLPFRLRARDHGPEADPGVRAAERGRGHTQGRHARHPHHLDALSRRHGGGSPRPDRNHHAGYRRTHLDSRGAHGQDGRRGPGLPLHERRGPVRPRTLLLQRRFHRASGKDLLQRLWRLPAGISSQLHRPGGCRIRPGEPPSVLPAEPLHPGRLENLPAADSQPGFPLGAPQRLARGQQPLGSLRHLHRPDRLCQGLPAELQGEVPLPHGGGQHHGGADERPGPRASASPIAP